MKKKVLVVEDNRATLAITTSLLNSEGYETRGVQSGLAALSVLKEMTPDLVLLDVMLPGMDGFKVCQHIKTSPSTRNIPVVMVSAKDTQDDRDRGQRAGADCYITKPYSSDDALSVIRQLLSPAE